MTFKLATWNVNSLRVRLPQVLQWLDEVKPHVLALQETKITDADFPAAALQDAGYRAIYSGQKAYNGVALLVQQSIADNADTVLTDIPILEDTQRRVLCATVADVRILNLYVPNGESLVSEKYQYKLNWLKHLDDFLKQELKKYPKFVVLGDFNIAPAEIDVHDPAAWEGQVLCSEAERTAFQAMLQVGFRDCFREHAPLEKNYTWWDYRLNSFKRNRGLRIDHILASDIFAADCIQCYIDKMPRSSERPSDHAPVIAEFKK